MRDTRRSQYDNRHGFGAESYAVIAHLDPFLPLVYILLSSMGIGTAINVVAVVVGSMIGFSL